VRSPADNGFKFGRAYAKIPRHACEIAAVHIAEFAYSCRCFNQSPNRLMAFSTIGVLARAVIALSLTWLKAQHGRVATARRCDGSNSVSVSALIWLQQNLVQRAGIHPYSPAARTHAGTEYGVSGHPFARPGPPRGPTGHGRRCRGSVYGPTRAATCAGIEFRLLLPNTPYPRL
jgi:hypothetical protein